MCEPLPAIHAFSGCDYTACFMWKTEVKMYKKVESDEAYQQVFSKFGDCAEVTDDLLEETEKFFCDMYGKPRLSKLGDVRYALFQEKYAPTKMSNPLTKLKGANSSPLPPTTSVFLQKVKHTNFVSITWKNAHMQDPLADYVADPTNSGWKLTDGKYKLTCMVAEEYPHRIECFAFLQIKHTPQNSVLHG